MKSIGIVWAQFGPYHFARAAALQRLVGADNSVAFEIANRTSVYAWERSELKVNVITLCPGALFEKAPLPAVFLSARRELARAGVKVCLIPSYYPLPLLAFLLAAKSLGIKAVMMNEGHAGTSRARGLAAWLKRRLVSLFDSALVGGEPQKRYAAALGLPDAKIFTGYDAVDNDYFTQKAAEIRERQSAVRHQYDLPQNYFLSLGRFVAKKNLATLIRAYHRFLQSDHRRGTHLVMVGSGEEESSLRALCAELQLPVYQKIHSGAEKPASADSSFKDAAADVRRRKPDAESCEIRRVTSAATGTRSVSPETPPGVHFYGFRQLGENPVFYALANAFILPSSCEEWGLVVNEAMACGLPVVVSQTAGCAEDLLPPRESGIGTALGAEVSRDVERLRLAGQIRASGIAFDPGSVDELSRALILLDAHPNLRAEMSAQSRSIIGRFSCENFARNALLAVRAAMGEEVPQPAKMAGRQLQAESTPTAR
jgi:glycosyltransferase involved in cell wall biosynthesis